MFICNVFSFVIRRLINSLQKKRFEKHSIINGFRTNHFLTSAKIFLLDIWKKVLWAEETSIGYNTYGGRQVCYHCVTVTPRYSLCFNHYLKGRGHGCRVVTLSPPTSEAGVRFSARPQVGKLVVACRWSAVYSTEPWRTVCTGFLCPSN